MAKSKTETSNLFEEDNQSDLDVRYAYVMAQKNEKRGGVFDELGRAREEQEFRPYNNILLRSSILWDGSEDPFSGRKRAAGRQQIRYYDGCTTLFMDDQPKEKEIIDQLIASTEDISLMYGYCFVYGYDVMKKKYLDWCSFNEDSPYRIKTMIPKFKAVNTEKQSIEEGALLEMEDMARDLSKGASVKKMRVHARYLAIPFIDNVTLSPLSETAIRIEYRKYARTNPKHFVKTYHDKAIEVATWVTDALKTGEINTNILPNSAIWSKSGAEICELGGLKSEDLLIERLKEFALTEDGADFMAQLKALYS